MAVPLSRSQRQLIHYLGTGYSDSEVLRKMRFTEHQLQSAISDLCTRLHVADRVELLLWIWSHSTKEGYWSARGREFVSDVTNVLTRKPRT